MTLLNGCTLNLCISLVGVVVIVVVVVVVVVSNGSGGGGERMGLSYVAFVRLEVKIYCR